MAATIFSNASTMKPGMKVEVTQHIPSRVLKDPSSVEVSSDIRDGTSNTLGFQWGVDRGMVGRVVDKKMGRVYVALKGEGTTGGHGIIAILIGLKEPVFEKYFGERL